MLGQAQEFAARMEDTIARTLPGPVSVRAIRHPRNGRVRVSPVDPSDPINEVTLPLTSDGVRLADWSFVMFAEASSDGFLKVDQLRLWMTPAFEESPVVRLEYENHSTKPPVSHWQFHAERGALSFILARTRQDGKYAGVPMSLSALHFPTGGRRFRPGIEDFIQFLIQECGFDSMQGWRRVLEDSRELGRRFQVRTIARDYPAEVAEVLRQNGWSVHPPVNFDGWEATQALREF